MGKPVPTQRDKDSSSSPDPAGTQVPTPLEEKLGKVTKFMVEAEELRRLCQAVIDAYGDDDRISEFNAAVDRLAALPVGSRPPQEEPEPQYRDGVYRAGFKAGFEKARKLSKSVPNGVSLQTLEKVEAHGIALGHREAESQLAATHAAIRALLDEECDCDLVKRRQETSLPQHFLNHARWCKSQTEFAQKLSRLLGDQPAVTERNEE